MNTSFEDFKKSHGERYDKIEARLKEQQAEIDDTNIKLAAAEMGGQGNGKGESEGPATTVKALRSTADFRAHYGKRRPDNDVTLGQFMAGVAGMKTNEKVMASMAIGTDSSGGYVVPNVVMPGILSAMTPASSLLQAGAGIVPLDYGAKSVSVAVIDTLPTATWRNELGEITESQPTLRAVTATPRSLACIVRVSRELLADGADVDRALRVAIGQSIAKELDRVGLMGSGTAPEPLGLRGTPGVNTLSLGANGAALKNYKPLLQAYGSIIGVNAPAPTAAIMAPRTLLDFEGLEDTTGQQLRRPRLLDSLNFIGTSQIPTDEDVGTADNASPIFVGDFSGSYFLMREQLSIQMLREAYAKTGEIGFLVHVRADFVVPYPQQFVVINGVLPAE